MSERKQKGATCLLLGVRGTRKEANGDFPCLESSASSDLQCFNALPWASARKKPATIICGFSSGKSSVRKSKVNGQPRFLPLLPRVCIYIYLKVNGNKDKLIVYNNGL